MLSMIANPVTALPVGYPRSGLSRSDLVLLHHKVCGRMCLAVEAAQHGHRGNLRTRIAISRRRTVAIEFGMCRSGRRGGASGSVTVG